MRVPARKGAAGGTTICDYSAQLGCLAVHGSGRGDQEARLCRPEEVGDVVQEIRMEGQLVKGCVQSHTVTSNGRRQPVLRAPHQGQRDLRGHKRPSPALRCDPRLARPRFEVEGGKPRKFRAGVLGGCNRMNVSHCPALCRSARKAKSGRRAVWRTPQSEKDDFDGSDCALLWLTDPYQVAGRTGAPGWSTSGERSRSAIPGAQAASHGSPP